MINAWSLLYEELNGTMDDTYPLKKRDNMTDKNKDDVTLLGGDYDTITFNVPEGTVGAADTVSIDLGEVGSDTLNIGTPLPGGMGEDHISLDASGFLSGFGNTAYNDSSYYVTGNHYNFGDDPYPTVGSVEEWERIEKPQPDLNYKSQKYQEDKGIADHKDYVSSTYRGHYTNKNSDTQTLDLIHSVGDAEAFCRSNALKYLSRYDKKGSAKQDILKAMHYCLLLYYFSGNTQEPDTTNTRYETF